MTTNGIHSFAELIDRFGGASAFSRYIGIGVSTASEMKRRNAINSRYWALIIKAAPVVGLKGITMEKLQALYVRRPTGAAAE